jgi:hypothetical protein
MSRADIVAIAITASTLIFCLVFILNPPMPKYLPLEREWRMGDTGPVIAMGWYGRTAAALLAGAFAGAAAASLAGALAKTADRRLSPKTVLAMTAFSLLALLAASARIIHEQSMWFTCP